MDQTHLSDSMTYISIGVKVIQTILRSSEREKEKYTLIPCFCLKSDFDHVDVCIICCKCFEDKLVVLLSSHYPFCNGFSDDVHTFY